jgi:hypothetical protein
MRSFNRSFKLITVAISVVLLLSSNIVMAETGSSSKKSRVEQDQVVQEVQANEDSSKNEIPIKMEPGTIITYNLNLEPTDSQDPNNNKEFVDKEGRGRDDPPTPVPGMSVMYGSDGRINHIWVDVPAVTGTSKEIKEQTNFSVRVVKESDETENEPAYWVTGHGYRMLPLRAVAEKVGYTVKWDQASRSAEVRKGASWTTVQKDTDYYLYNDMAPISLGIAPVIINGSLYVLQDFFSDVLQLYVELEQGTDFLFISQPQDHKIALYGVIGTEVSISLSAIRRDA